MSELTTCNFCNLRGIRARYKGTGTRLYMRPSNFMGGTDIFAVPAGEKLPPREKMVSPCDKYPNGNEAYDKYHISWMMEIPSQCAC
ncbi:MAG: hypothetical protein KAU20_02335 [Nanoarchaeota archaeon]|nr:hypothetical protein [Nanoarchaeota archaeon]